MEQARHEIFIAEFNLVYLAAIEGQYTPTPKNQFPHVGFLAIKFFKI
jgi:hypothetical protein